MSEEKKYNFYSAADIEKYHKGLLSPKEMNELEKAALDDPFLADALEGYGKVQVNLVSDIEELEKKLGDRMTGTKIVPISRGFSINRFLKVAAVVVFVSAAALAIYKLGFQSEKPLAIKFQKQQPQQSPIVSDTNKNVGTVTNNGNTTVNANTNGAVQQQTKKAGREKVLSDSSTTISVMNGASSQAGVVVSNKAFDNQNFTPGLSTQRPADTLKNSAGAFKTEAEQRLLSNEIVVYDAGSRKNQANKKVKQSQPVAVTASADDYKPNARKDSSTGFDNDKKEKAVATNYFRGRILDNSNNALPFANISNVKDNVGTYADAQGYFTLISPDSVLNVKIKSVGFVNDTVQLGNAAFNKVVLKEENVQGLVLGGKRQGKIPTPQQNLQVEESEPADGWNNYNLYVANNINVPDRAREGQLHHEVKLSFEINHLGEPVNIQVENSDCKECNEEAIRLLKEGPKWKPKKKKSRVTLTIPF